MRTYTLVLSNKQKIHIDQTDMDKLQKVAPTGNLVLLKKAIINPSFIVCILPNPIEGAQKKIEGYLDEKRNVFVVTSEAESGELESDFPNQNEKRISSTN